MSQILSPISFLTASRGYLPWRTTSWAESRYQVRMVSLSIGQIYQRSREGDSATSPSVAQLCTRWTKMNFVKSMTCALLVGRHTQKISKPLIKPLSNVQEDRNADNLRDSFEVSDHSCAGGVSWIWFHESYC